MKFWRTILATASIGLIVPALSFATCEKNTELKEVFPLVMCKEAQDATSTGVGNQFPWEASTTFFSSYRNQYLFPANTVAELDSSEIQSMHSRAVSFTAGGTMNMRTDPLSGQVSFVEFTEAVAGTLVNTFSLNTKPGGLINRWDTTGNTIVTIGTWNGPNGSILSDCKSCPGADEIERGEAFLGVTLDTGAGDHIMIDNVTFVGTGNSGDTIWDAGSGGNLCPGKTFRAYGSGQFANPNHLTRALGVDGFDTVWVFKGLARPPAASIAQQMAEVIRLLLTPEGLRCSGLDLTPENSRNDDDAVAFPGGKDLDPVQPQISAIGTSVVTGDEIPDAKRRAGFSP
jgi:hypothetical protein